MPVHAKGSKASLRIYEETVAGTRPAALSPGLRVPLIDTDISKRQEFARSRVLQGSRNPGMPVHDAIDAGGGLTIQPDVRSIGFFHKWLMGAPVTSGAGPYVHTYLVGDPFPGLTVEKFYSDIARCGHTLGFILNGFSFDIGAGGLFEMNWNGLGIDEVWDLTAPLDAAPYAPAVEAIRVPRVTLAEGGAPLTIATRFNMTVTNNLAVQRTLGNQGKAYGIDTGLIGVTFTMDVLFPDMVLYNKALNGTESSILLTFPGKTVGHSLQYEMQEVVYSVGSPGIPGPGGIPASLSGEAYFEDGAAASTLKVILTNDVASYVAIP